MTRQDQISSYACLLKELQKKHGSAAVLNPVQVQPNVMQPQRHTGIKKQIVPQKSVEQTVVEKKEDKQGADKKEQNRNF